MIMDLVTETDAAILEVSNICGHIIKTYNSHFIEIYSVVLSVSFKNILFIEINSDL